MAISFVAAGAVATGTSPTVAVPAGYAQGDLLVLAVAANAAVTTPSGWTLIGSQTTTPRIYLYRKFATGSEASVAVTVASTTAAAVMLAYRGVSALDALSTGTTATSTTIATGILTTSYANEYVVSAYAMTIGAATWTAPASTTSRVNSAGTASVDGLLIVDEAQAAAGVSTARTATSSVSKALAAISFSIIPSGRYWVGGSGAWDTTSTTNWSFSSGGASGALAPTAQDNVTFDQAGTYTVTCTGALTCNDITVSAGTVTFADGTSPTFAISGSMSLVAATVWSSSASLTFNATTTGKTITTNGVALGSGAIVVFNGVGGGWTLGSALSVSNNISFTNGTFSTSASNYALNQTNNASIIVNGGTVTLNGSTVTLNGVTSWTYTSGTVNAGTSQINLAVTPATFAGGGQTYYNVTNTANSSSTTTITGANTFNNLTINPTTAGSVKPVAFGANQTINGTFTLSAGTDATMRTFAQSDTAGTSRTLTCAAVSFTDADFQDITIAGTAAPASGTRLGDCKGNSGITFGAGVNKYWNLAAGGNWGGAVAWATTSGGSPAINNFPLAQDTCIFDSSTATLSSGSTVTINTSYNIGTINMSARTSNTMTLATGTATPIIYGNWINGTGTTISGTTSTITFGGRTTQQLTSAGKTFTCITLLDSIGGSLVLQDNYANSRTSGALQVKNGTFNANSFNCTFTGTSGAALNVPSTSGSVVLAFGTNSVWNFGGTGLGVTISAATVTTTGNATFNMNASSTKTFTGGGNNLSGITLNQGGAGALTIQGSNTFNNITNTYASTGATTITFAKGYTHTVAAFTATGQATRLLTLNSDITNVQASIALTGGGTVTTPNYLNVQDLSFTPFATDGTAPYKWYAGANSTNSGNNSGILFAASTVVAYLLLSNSSWTVPANWNNSSNTIHMIGGGGGGAGGYVSGANRAGGGGGGGGGYTKLTNQTLSGTVTYAIGAAGTAGAANGNGVAGGTTSWNSGASTAGGGGGGQTTTTPTSTGGTAGTGTTFNGGTGGAGSTTTTTQFSGGGGGGGAGGPNGAGGTGGLGFSAGSQNLAAGGGGGGNGGGTNGAAGASGVGGSGGNNFAGTGGSTTANTAGTFGGGGIGSVGTSATWPSGGAGIDISNTVGGGGGMGGGSIAAPSTFANNGLYGSGGAGAGGGTTARAGAAGSQGMIFIIYTPGGGAGTSGNFFLMF